MKKIKLDTLPPKGLHGTVDIPGDKSISHRALMVGAISEGQTTINHFLWSQDCQNTLEALRQLGIKIEANREQVIVHGKGVRGLEASAQPLEMGNSGTTTRLLMGLLAGTDFTSRLQGDSSLSKRPMKRVAEPLSKMGAQIETTKLGTLPVIVKGSKIHGTKLQLQVASAQVKSAVIFAALQADTPMTVIEKLPTRNHTELMLRKFGADISTEKDQKTINIKPANRLRGQIVNVPGDISSAAFFLVAATIVPNSRITLKNVSLNPTRTGILNVLKRMGANFKILYRENNDESYGDIEISASNLKSARITGVEIPALIDELPLVALLAACADGKSEIRGAAELRVKETDRISTVTQELSKLGVLVTELPDGMIIHGRKNWKTNTVELDSHGDHRIGMMLAIAALRTDQELYLNDPAAIAVSYPSFFEDLKSLLNVRK
ncbi:3-phosphoshikimate 1-carboxyvinyltransferase [Liquorilactobacillus hordei]|uniref:3-phosphoshikimate 1-carboxyvinyltransferase n=1 Tax=Liquorilactobacillus hordei TaxID=468911 RepID=A0A3S6QLM9_9LACO|nr:3-phosphoshikimate 1-carboxyvinyltransferase [Liquorilactobacillus hordei]AUJ28804.1 3-phosphoshikimate 1-carboxyvinyltransferase [Liquorilactobacillus hordei]MBZ2406208.1 3-phosphoshikimate 1-carboxyvinyltransferase [Liquorilactobacillus hordei]